MMWGQHMNLSFTDGKTGMQRNSYPTQGPMTISARAKNKTWVCQTPKLMALQQRRGTESNPKLGSHWCYSAATSEKDLLRLPCGHYSKGALPYGQHGALGNLSYCVTGAWVTGARTQGGTDIGVCANYRSSRQKNVLSGCKEWKKLEYPKLSMKGLTQ